MNRITAKWILVVGAIAAIIYGFPGYLTNESSLQLGQARIGHYDNAVPPLMARYWRLTDQLFHGPLPMLILQVCLFAWGAYGLLRTRFSPRVSAIATVALLWFPPVLAPMSVVWKEAQMAGWLLAGTMLMLRPSARARIGGLVMLVVGCAVCRVAMWGLFPLVVLIVREAGVRGLVRVTLASLAMVAIVVGTARMIDRHYTDREAHVWERTTVAHDIAGTLCYAPHMPEPEVDELLAGLNLQKQGVIQGRLCNGWSPRRPLTVNPDTSVFDLSPTAPDFKARITVRDRLIAKFPGSYATQRSRVIVELIGLGKLPPEDTTLQSFWGNDTQAHKLFVDSGPSAVQRSLGGWIAALGTTSLFRPWIYVAIAILVLGFAIVKRDGLVITLVTSGLASELNVALAAPAPDYRYSHWMIACTCLAVIFVVGRSRWRG